MTRVTKKESKIKWFEFFEEGGEVTHSPAPLKKSTIKFNSEHDKKDVVEIISPSSTKKNGCNIL